MKKSYLKPATEEELLSSDNLMITASGDGEKIVEYGGSTDNEGITEGDSRRRTVWDDEDY